MIRVKKNKRKLLVKRFIMTSLPSIVEEGQVGHDEKQVYVHGKMEVVFCTPNIHVFPHILHYIKEFKARGQQLKNIVVLTTPKRLIQWTQASPALNQVFDDAVLDGYHWTKFTNDAFAQYEGKWHECVIVLDRVNSKALINKPWFNNMMLCNVVLFTMNHAYVPEILKVNPETYVCMYKTLKRAKYDNYVDNLLFHESVNTEKVGTELKRLHSDDEVLLYIKDHNMFQTYSLTSSQFVDCKTVSVPTEDLDTKFVVPHVDVSPPFHPCNASHSGKVDMNRIYISISCVLAPLQPDNTMYEDVMRACENETKERKADSDDVLNRLFVEEFHHVTNEYLSQNVVFSKISKRVNENAVQLDNGDHVIQYTFCTKLRNRELFLNFWYHVMDVYKKGRVISKWFLQFD